MKSFLTSAKRLMSRQVRMAPNTRNSAPVLKIVEQQIMVAMVLDLILLVSRSVVIPFFDFLLLINVASSTQLYLLVLASYKEYNIRR